MPLYFLLNLSVSGLRADQIEVFKILHGYSFSRSRKREGLEDMELH